MRVLPLTSGIRRPTWSTKHQDQSSPGSSERISGCARPSGVSGGVAHRRVIAAADMPAVEADPEVEPLRPGGEALLTALD